VLDVLTYASPECERFVVVFGQGEAGSSTAAAADSWPTDARLGVSGSVVELGLPTIGWVVPWAQTIEGPTGSSFALATRESARVICDRVGQPCDQEPSPGQAITMRMFFDSNRRAHVTYLTQPARVVIDVKPAPTGTGLDVSANRASSTVVLPIQVDVAGPGVTPPIVVQGWARPFEATGVAVLRRPGEEPGSGERVEATFTGTDFAGTMTDSQYPFMTNDYTDAWGAFTFTIAALDPGSYELFVGEFSMEDGSERGVYLDFRVAS
jgi:hypothetical protein